MFRLCPIIVLFLCNGSSQGDGNGLVRRNGGFLEPFERIESERLAVPQQAEIVGGKNNVLIADVCDSQSDVGLIEISGRRTASNDLSVDGNVAGTGLLAAAWFELAAVDTNCLSGFRFRRRFGRRFRFGSRLRRSILFWLIRCCVRSSVGGVGPNIRCGFRGGRRACGSGRCVSATSRKKQSCGEQERKEKNKNTFHLKNLLLEQKFQYRCC